MEKMSKTNQKFWSQMNAFISQRLIYYVVEDAKRIIEEVKYQSKTVQHQCRHVPNIRA